MAAVAAILDIGTERFNNYESLCHNDDSHRFSSIGLMVLEEMSFKEFQDGCPGGNLGCRDRTILAILNLCVTGMPLTKFWLNPSYVWEEMSFEEFQDGRYGGHLGYRNGTILAILNLCVTVMPPIVSAQSDLRFGRRYRLKNFKMGASLAILNVHVATMPPTKFQLNPT